MQGIAAGKVNARRNLKPIDAQMPAIKPSENGKITRS